MTHRYDVGLHLLGHQGETPVDENFVPDGVGRLLEDVRAAVGVELEAAGIRQGEVLSDWRVAKVGIAREKVVAAAAVEIPVELVPFGGDGGLDAVTDEVALDVGRTHRVLGDEVAHLQAEEDGDELADEGDAQQEAVQNVEELLVHAGNGEAVEAHLGNKNDRQL